MNILIDLSYTIHDQMPVYPGDAGVSLSQTKFIDKDGYNAVSLRSGMHSGTHIDMPVHLSEENNTDSADLFPLDCFVGRGVLVDARSGDIDNSLSCIKFSENDIAVIFTAWDRLWGTEAYFKHPEMSVMSAELLINAGVKAVALDTPSPDLPPFYAHKLLSDNGIFIIENLTNLNELYSVTENGVKSFRFFAVPLKIRAEASLVRAFAEIAVNV